MTVTEALKEAIVAVTLPKEKMIDAGRLVREDTFTEFIVSLVDGLILDGPTKFRYYSRLHLAFEIGMKTQEILNAHNSKEV